MVDFFQFIVSNKESAFLIISLFLIVLLYRDSKKREDYILETTDNREKRYVKNEENFKEIEYRFFEMLKADFNNISDEIKEIKNKSEDIKDGLEEINKKIDTMENKLDIVLKNRGDLNGNDRLK